MNTTKLNIKIIPHASGCPDVNEESPTKKQKMIAGLQATQCLDCLRRAFETQDSAQVIYVTVAQEKAKDRAEGEAAWHALCKDIFGSQEESNKKTRKSPDKTTIGSTRKSPPEKPNAASKSTRKGPTIPKKADLMVEQGEQVPPHHFYEAYLKQYVGTLFLSTIKTMWELGVFETNTPEAQPFVLFSKQITSPADVSPKIEAYIPLQDLLDNGLIFEDIKDFNPIAKVIGFEQAKPIAYGLFYSFYTGFNLATAFYRNFRGEWGYRWAVYDRLQVGEAGSISDSK